MRVGGGAGGGVAEGDEGGFWLLGRAGGGLGCLGRHFWWVGGSMRGFGFGF